MNNSKRSKKIKCFQCQTYNGFFSHLKYSECCQTLLCPRCLNHHKCLKSIIINPNFCQRCMSKKASIQCKTCKNKIYCVECDHIIHKSSKFSDHERSQISKNSQKQQPKEPSKLSQLKEEFNVYQLQINLIETQIQQKWEQIIKIICQKFETVFEQIQQKKSQILDKLIYRKQQDLNKLYNYKEIRIKKDQKDSIKNLQTQLKQFRALLLSSSDKKGFNILNINQKVFQDLTKAMEKVNTKNIFIKLKEKEQNMKKNMRSSCVLSNLSTHSINLNTSTIMQNKNQKNYNPKLSRSTMEQDFKELFEMASVYQEDLMTNVKIPEKQLIKVKSQKYFYNQLFKQPQSINIKKQKK